MPGAMLWLIGIPAHLNDLKEKRESCCCAHFAIQGTRFWLMDTRQIQPDPTDNQVIRCHNALQCLACICELAAFVSQDADAIDARRELEAELAAEAEALTLRPLPRKMVLLMNRGLS